MVLANPIFRFLCIVAVLLAVGGCAGSGTTTSSDSSMAGSSAFAPGSQNLSSTTQAANSGRDLTTVQSWSIRTSENLGTTPSIDDLVTDKSDLLIVSPGDLKSPDTTLEKQVSTIRGKSTKRILALIDVASLDTKSTLWESSWLADSSGKLSAAAPAWLVPPDLGNGASAPSVYRVAYWDRGWLSKLGSEIVNLRKAGFDGICLSGGDLYQSTLAARPTSGADMATLIENVANESRSHSPSFLVVPIDSAMLVESLTESQRTTYLGTIDAVMAEGVFYRGGNPSDSDLNPQADLITALDLYRGAHKPVFVMDDLTSTDKVADFVSRAKIRGFVPYALQPAPTGPPAPVPASYTPATPTTTTTPNG